MKLGYDSKWLPTAKRIAADSKSSSIVTALHIVALIVGFIASTLHPEKRIVYDSNVYDEISQAIESPIVRQVSLGCCCVCIPLIIDYFLDAVRLRKQVNFSISQWTLLLSVMGPCVVYYVVAMRSGRPSIGNFRAFALIR
jgi:hypothetical protein